MRFYDNLTKNALVIVLGVDLSEAFDTIDYKVLNDIVHGRFNIKGVCKDWIISCVSN